MRLYVGNLNYDTDDDDLRDHFEKFGEIVEVRVIRNAIGNSRGFGFVVMSDADGARAISELDGSVLDRRALNVSEARERKYH